MLADILFVFDKPVANELFEMSIHRLNPRHSIDNVAREMKAVELVQYGHIERGSRRSFFPVAVDVQIAMVLATIGEAMNEGGVAVVGEYDRLIGRKHRVEVAVGKPVGVF